MDKVILKKVYKKYKGRKPETEAELEVAELLVQSEEASAEIEKIRPKE